MGTVTWSGATDGNWNTGTNWVGGAAPVGGDDVVFPANTVSVTTGPSSAINLASLTVQPGYVGSWTDTITLGTVTLLAFSGSGSSYNLSATVTTARFSIGKGVSFTCGSGTWTNTYASGQTGGRLYVTGATLTNKYCSGINVEETSGGSASTITQIEGGSYKSAKNPGTLTAGGGATILVTGTATVTAATCGRNVVYNHQSSGTVSALTLKPGSQYPNMGAVSHTVSQLNLWPNAYFNYNPPGATITVSATSYFGYQGSSTPIIPGP